MIAGVLILLAIFGAAALVLRLFRSVGRTILGAAEAAAANGLAEAGARRGDLTAMQEGRAVERGAIASRRRAAIAAVFWLLWLALPIVFEYLPIGYAVAAPLWLVPPQPSARVDRPPSNSESR